MFLPGESNVYVLLEVEERAGEANLDIFPRSK